MRRALPRLGLLGALGLAALTALTLVAAPAMAHATLQRMTPAVGSVVTTPPARVTLYFDENVRAPSKILVTGPSGRVDHGPTEVVNNTASVAVSVQSRPSDVGAYRAAYRVVSADGHVVSATESFRFAPPGVRAAPSRATDPVGSSSHSADHHVWWWVAGVAAVLLVAWLLLMPRRRPGTERR
ncbi:MAG: copper resistance protein CopC [Marmoricola sp.]|nr:copper resistance protein CopC [Marmoricola sp.]